MIVQEWGKKSGLIESCQGVRLILRTHENKKEFASPTSILIDDRDINVEQWVKNGGELVFYIHQQNQQLKS